MCGAIAIGSSVLVRGGRWRRCLGCRGSCRGIGWLVGDRWDGGFLLLGLGCLGGGGCRRLGSWLLSSEFRV